MEKNSEPKNFKVFLQTFTSGPNSDHRIALPHRRNDESGVNVKKLFGFVTGTQDCAASLVLNASTSTHYCGVTSSTNAKNVSLVLLKMRLIWAEDKYARIFVSVKYFHPSLISAGKVTPL